LAITREFQVVLNAPALWPDRQADSQLGDFGGESIMVAA